MTVSKKALAKYLDIDPSQIVGMHENPDRVVVVVDKGIAGSPKYTIPMSELNKPAPPPKEPVPVIEPEAPQDNDADLDDLTVVELQAEAKERGIPYAGLRKAELIEALGGDE